MTNHRVASFLNLIFHISPQTLAPCIERQGMIVITLQQFLFKLKVYTYNLLLFQTLPRFLFQTATLHSLI